MPEAHSTQRFKVDAAAAGTRLDVFLAQQLRQAVTRITVGAKNQYGQPSHDETILTPRRLSRVTNDRAVDAQLVS